MSALSRRDFLRLGAGLGAGLVLGACAGSGGHTLFAPRPASGDEGDLDAPMLGWLSIQPDGEIHIAVASSEMGQGVYTNLALLVAEELDADFSQVRARPAGVHKQFANPKLFGGQVTGGSTSTAGYWTPMREVGATARAMLIEAAAEQWQCDAATLRTEQGRVVHPDGRTLDYASLAPAAGKRTPPKTPPLKARADYRLIGTSVARLDTPAKVRGEAVFGADVRLPNMLFASVRHARALRGRIARVEGREAVLAQAGVVAVEVFDTWVAVVADGWWKANQAVRQLNVIEDHSALRFRTTEEQREALRAALDEAGPRPPPAEARHRIEAEYEVPFLEHATMSTMTATADVRATRCDVWAPTQAQTASHDVAVEVTGLAPEQVHIHTTFLGGGFGRRSNTDFVRQAVLLSKRLARPVQVLWSREETTQHGYYRPAARCRFQIGVSAAGEADHWAAQIAVPHVLEQQIPAVPSFVWRLAGDPIATEGLKEPPYATGTCDVDSVAVALDTPIGFWRAVGHSHNGFFVESVVDEIAAVSGQDPADYRRKCYQNHPRHRAVLDAVTRMAGWGKPRPAGRHLGLAVHESFGSVAGEVVELSVDADKNVTLHRIWCAIECGIPLNRDSIAAQMQGGVVFALSAATRAENTLVEGGIAESNFHDYPAMRMAEVPAIEVEVLDSDRDPSGVGEVGVPPLAAALGNAIFAATGERVRRLPFSRAGFGVWRASREAMPSTEPSAGG